MGGTRATYFFSVLLMTIEFIAGRSLRDLSSYGSQTPLCIGQFSHIAQFQGSPKNRAAPLKAEKLLNADSWAPFLEILIQSGKDGS